MIKKIIFTVLVLLLFIFAGYFYQLPTQKVVEKQIINDPQIIYEKEIVEKEVPLVGQSVIVHAVGVYNNTDGGEIVDIRMTAKAGTGRNFFDSTAHSFGTDIQEGITLIRNSAETYLRRSTLQYDLFIDIKISSSLVSGTSGNAFMATGLVALMEDKQIDPSVIITGAISNNGLVLPVGQLPEKVKIVEKSHFTKLLIPQPQCEEVSSDKIEIICVRSLEQAVDNAVIE